MALDENGRGSRPDLIVQVHHAVEYTGLESSIDIVMIESKIGTVEGEDQLKRYAGHLNSMSGMRKTLVYITRAYEPKDADDIHSGLDGVCFKQLRWHDFYRFLQTVEKDALIEEVMAFMEEQGMARSYRFSTADLMALSGVPRAFEIFDETLGEEVKEELESFAGNKARGETQGMGNIRKNRRYITVAPLHEWNLYCYIGYALSTSDGYPEAVVHLEARPGAIGKKASVDTMKKITLLEGWEGYNLDDAQGWAGAWRRVSLTSLLSEEDHIAAVKRFFIESLRQLREELTGFKKEHPDLLWSGG
ncbi:MAG: PD-(D/E)XK nuclease family protein [Rubrobacter sp.]